jgi:hypothetical protein
MFCDEFSTGRYSNLNFQTQKKHHQTPNIPSRYKHKTMQIEKPTKTNPHTNAYDFCVELYYKLKSLGLKANNFTYPFLFIA